MTAAAEEEKRRLAALARGHVRMAGRCGVNAAPKIGCLVAGMAAGADSIDDMGVLRHGAMPDLFDGVRAPTTLGSFLRSFTWGNVRQLEKVGQTKIQGKTVLARGLNALAAVVSTPQAAPGSGQPGCAAAARTPAAALRACSPRRSAPRGRPGARDHRGPDGLRLLQRRGVPGGPAARARSSPSPPGWTPR